jgi:hypothetical protein
MTGVDVGVQTSAFFRRRGEFPRRLSPREAVDVGLSPSLPGPSRARTIARWVREGKK